MRESVGFIADCIRGAILGDSALVTTLCSCNYALLQSTDLAIPFASGHQ